MPAKTRNSARIDFRLSPEHKDLIERAASALGQTVSDFATTTLLYRAQQAVQESVVTRLTQRDRDRFLAMLDDDSPPNAALRKAAKRYGRGG